MEKWKTITECPNYSISSYGRVRNNKTARILKSNPASNGYFHVKLCSKTIYIHHLVARYYLGVRPSGKVVSHKNDNKHINHFKNLEYISQKENLRKSSNHTITKSEMNKGYQFISTDDT